MREDHHGCFTLDPGLTALALRGLKKREPYPFLERVLRRRRRIRAWLSLMKGTYGCAMVRHLDQQRL